MSHQKCASFVAPVDDLQLQLSQILSCCTGQASTEGPFISDKNIYPFARLGTDRLDSSISHNIMYFSRRVYMKNAALQV